MHLTPQSIAREIASLGGDRDVTLIFEDLASERRLLVAIDGDSAILGLEQSGAVYQFRTNGSSDPQSFTVGGQETEIESRYVLDLDSATTIAGEWLQAVASSALGYWEQR